MESLQAQELTVTIMITNMNIITKMVDVDTVVTMIPKRNHVETAAMMTQKAAAVDAVAVVDAILLLHSLKVQTLVRHAALTIRELLMMAQYLIHLTTEVSQSSSYAVWA